MELFWETLFEKKKLAPQLATLATKHVDWITYDDMPQYGKLRVKVEFGSTLGDNIQSDTFIVTVQLTQPDSTTNDETSVITLSTFVKVLPSNSFLRQAVNEARTHHREINMYENVFRLLREQYDDLYTSLDVPYVYYTHLEKMDKGETDGSGTCTLLENLKAQNYRMADKVEGADFRHCFMALVSLAKYHAMTIGAVRTWKDPTTGELSQIPAAAKFLVEEKTFYDYGIVKFVENYSKCFLDFAREVERADLGEWLVELLQRLPEIILVDTIESCGPLACILHGDYWINNMLFKYRYEKDSAPDFFKMINFQMSRIGHPLSDVLYFFYTSTKPETRQKYMLALLRYYFDTLKTELRRYGIPINDYSWKDFLVDYKKRSLMWMFLSVIVLSADKKSLSNLQDQENKDKLKGPKPEKYMESIKGEMRVSKGLSTLAFLENCCRKNWKYLATKPSIMPAPFPTFLPVSTVERFRILSPSHLILLLCYPYSNFSIFSVQPKKFMARGVDNPLGINLEMEETMKNWKASYKLSESPILSDRIVKLMDEVKTLNCC